MSGFCPQYPYFPPAEGCAKVSTSTQFPIDLHPFRKLRVRHPLAKRDAVSHNHCWFQDFHCLLEMTSAFALHYAAGIPLARPFLAFASRFLQRRTKAGSSPERSHRRCAHRQGSARLPGPCQLRAPGSRRRVDVTPRICGFRSLKLFRAEHAIMFDRSARSTRSQDCPYSWPNIAIRIQRPVHFEVVVPSNITHLSRVERKFFCGSPCIQSGYCR